MLLKKVRLSFPALFTPTAFQGEGDKKYEATFLIEKGSANHKLIKEAVDKMVKEEYNGKLSADRICLKDGDDKEWEGYDGHMYVKSSSKRRIPVIGRDKSPLLEEDQKIYAGCYVNASIELWAQKGQWGSRVNAGLRGVQFDSDGEAFSGASVADDDDFVDYEEEVSF
jgi:hypothetical protein